MQLVQPITATHDGVIHDVAYDFFGKRMASCSSDHKIKIWDKDEKNGEWVCSAVPTTQPVSTSTNAKWTPAKQDMSLSLFIQTKIIILCRSYKIMHTYSLHALK